MYCVRFVNWLKWKKKFIKETTRVELKCDVHNLFNSNKNIIARWVKIPSGYFISESENVMKYLTISAINGVLILVDILNLTRLYLGILSKSVRVYHSVILNIK